MLPLRSAEQTKAIKNEQTRNGTNGSFESTIPVLPHSFRADVAYYELSPTAPFFMVTAEDRLDNGKTFNFTMAIPQNAKDGIANVSFDPSSQTDALVLFFGNVMHGGRSGFIKFEHSISEKRLKATFDFVDHLNGRFKGELDVYELNQ
ncbi:hypothetical protein [Pseudomonas sp. C2B4]|uniref:hypothetical protein n=1 Tax=Pseudomonas sp. C2B4 TaxID=2735270 RepID=UPI00158653B4|nr:hypothetical protein [Pseudomonas sp. C2B4]NUU33922.1 hypothetical protein [Pseudomonas sp. C2B4]